MSSGRKRVSFKEESSVKIKHSQKIHSQNSHYVEYGETNVSDNEDSETPIKQPKHTLESDDEEDNADKYELLNRHVLNEIGQEAKTLEFDENIKITPFNMKDELDEGNFDTEGYFHWKKKDDIKDAWLDNIDWNNSKSYRFNAKDNLIDAAVKSGTIDKYNLQETNNENESSQSSSEDEEEDDLITNTKSELNLNEKNELLKAIFSYLKPGETILKAIKRLGSNQKTSMSASQRWLKKKQENKSNNNSNVSKEDSIALEKLTSLSNKFIEIGYYDIYEETYEKIKFNLESKNDTDSFDMFADDADVARSSKQNDDKTEDKLVKWYYKEVNSDDAPLKGPFTSEQMLKMNENGTFKDSGVWCKKTDDTSNNFYNSKRIDFDLYT